MRTLTSPGWWKADTPKSLIFKTCAAVPAGALSSVGAPSRKFSGLMSRCTIPSLQDSTDSSVRMAANTAP